jgi:hypothetical protein
LTGEGLEEGLDWLTNEICEKQSKPNTSSWTNPVNILSGGGRDAVLGEQAIETFEQKKAR